MTTAERKAEPRIRRRKVALVLGGGGLKGFAHIGVLRALDEMGLKPRNAFGPVRVAVTGRRISPPLFESLELLGSERALARLAAAATG